MAMSKFGDHGEGMNVAPKTTSDNSHTYSMANSTVNSSHSIPTSMPCPKSVILLETAQKKVKNDKTQDKLEDAYRKVQELKESGQKPNISQIALQFDIPCATLDHCVNGQLSK